MKYSICEDYKKIDTQKAVAIVPIKGFNISEKYTINDIKIYPVGTVDREGLKEGQFNFDFEKISDDFYQSTLVTFPITYTRINMMGSLMPSEKDRVIKKVFGIAEDIMNVFRYIYSNFDKVSNLPQRAGYINDIISGLLLYYPYMKKSDYIEEKYYVLNVSLSKGLEVDMNNIKKELNKYSCVLKSESGEVGNILRHAFRIYSDILYMPSVTNKFMQAMSLIEYLANPFEYEQMKKVKTKIVPFSADSKKKYHEICERFKYLTSLKDEKGIEIGLRTSIVHNGKNLEELLDKGYKVDLLLRELQEYICNFINNIISYYEKDWSFVEQKIEEKLQIVENIKSGYEGKLEADTTILIDFEFFNKAIKEVYQLYPNKKDIRFDLSKFIYLLMIQADIERKGYQIPIQFIYKNDEKIYNSIDNRKVSQLDGLGFDSPLGETSIYIFDAKKDYYGLMEILFKGLLIERNYNIDCTAKFKNIILVSDRNRLSDDIFIEIKKSYKKIILGRLDNKRTTCYDECTWFDLQLVILKCLGIEYYEDCCDNFIFKVEDGKYI